MDEAVQVLVELNEFIWKRFKKDLEDLTPEEADWRPAPEANSINLILRHLRIDAPWHVARIERQEPDQRSLDSVPLDFQQNLKELDEACTRFIAGLRAMAGADLRERSGVAHRDSPRGPVPMLGFHLALHLTGHAGQIRSLRNLYQKARGKPARFLPENPTFPTKGA
jgi:hypothetical protein